MNKICIIGVYFGRFNKYFSLWLKSCAHNPTIDFLIYTDAVHPDVLPANVRFEYMTIPKFNELASRKLGIEVCIKRPYKCCDFKPMYGLIFEDDIRQYCYWGECDFDLIWGDLQSYFDKYNLFNYDKFSPLGHLSLYKNTYEVNRSFMLEGDNCGGWKHVVQSNENFAFDEIPGICEIFIKNNLTFFKSKLFADITPMYERFKISEYCYLDDNRIMNYNHQIFYWEDGKIYRSYIDDDMSVKREEFMYIHFRSRPNFVINDMLETCSSFLITNAGFIIKDSEISIQLIQSYNPYKSKWYEMGEWLFHKLKSIKRIFIL